MAVVLRPLPEDKAVVELAQQVRAARADIRLRIQAQVLRGKPTLQLRRLEAELQGVLRYLEQYMELWTATQIPASWQRGYGRAISTLRQAGVMLSGQAGFTGVMMPAANLLAENLIRQFEVGTAQQLVEASAIAGRFVGRRVDDMYRRLGLEAGAQRVLTGKAYTAVAADEVARLEAEGVLFFTDAAGKRWTLEAYTQMVGRTVLRETEAMALITGLVDNGHDLVYIPWHSPTCKVCARYQDRVYSITGRTPGFPRLPHWPPHPNCRHPVDPYVLEADPNRAATEERSRRPFEDPRSDTEVAAYETTQERNRLIRRERSLAQLKASSTVQLGKRGEELARLARGGDLAARGKLVELEQRLLTGVDDRLIETRRQLRALPKPERAYGGLRKRP